MTLEEQVHIACCWEGCGHVICLSRETEKQYRRNHAFFKCPAGHSQHFPGKTDEDRIAELEKLVDMADRTKDRYRDLFHSANEQVAELRVLARTCPVCGVKRRTRPSMIRHVLADHITQEEWERVQELEAAKV